MLRVRADGTDHRGGTSDRADGGRLVQGAEAGRGIQLLKAHDFVGGKDNAPAIADALIALEAESEAALLWVHGPQPVSFQGGAARRAGGKPSVAAAARQSLCHGTRAERVAAGCTMGVGGPSLPATGTPADDLAAYVNAAFATAPKIEVRRRAPTRRTLQRRVRSTSRGCGRQTACPSLCAKPESAQTRWRWPPSFAS